MTGAVLNAALAYINLGWALVPVPWMSKAPVLEGWPDLRISAEAAPRYFNGEQMNLGAILGPASSNLADVDLDCRETAQTAPWFLPATPCMFGRKSRRAAHWFYYATDFSFSKAREVYYDPTRTGKEAVLLELRIGGREKGCQTILPPSRHEEGEDITWEPGGPGDPARVAGDLLEGKVSKTASAALLARYWPPKGQRHDAALAIGAALRRSKWSTSDIKLFVTAVCAAAGDEEPKDRRQAAVDSCVAVDAGKNAYGIPKLAELLGDKVTGAIVGWLNLQGDVWSTHAQAEVPEGAVLPPNWPEPQPLPADLLPVAPFTTDFLPFVLSSWVDDIAERMQCPPEFIAVTAVAALGAVLGRRIGVRPQQRTDWVEVCSFWGCPVGRPGWLKSPAMAEALKPLMRLETEAQQKNEQARRAYEQELELWNLKKKARESAVRSELKRDRNARFDFKEEKPEEPQAKRYVTNDSSYEALGQLLVANPTGILVFRDELVSLLKTLDREEYASARGFFMTAWGGRSPYTFDRIIRGHQHIKAAFVGLVGSTQPGRIAEYLRRATSTAEGNDGLIQRFSLLVWPDVSPHWRDTDAFPNTKAREAAWEVFERFSKLDTLAVKAQFDTFDALPYLRFDTAAQGLFNEWRGEFEIRIRSGELPEALEGHLAKFRKLVPTLALLNHLADGGEGSIPQDALERALAFARYLETHAKRAYAAVTGTDADAARRILAHIRSGDLKDGFKARDIQHRDWSGLTDRERIGKGLELLADCDWIAPQAGGRNPAGGRPTTFYNINPRVRP